MTNEARRRVAGRGLDWRFEWMRYAIRTHGSKATVVAVASALAAHAHNRDGTVFLSSETLAAEIGKQENHAKDARGVLVASGFLVDAGRTRRGCKVWYLTAPPVAIERNGRARAAEERLHARITRDPDLGSPDPDLGTPGYPDLGTEGPRSRNARTQISGPIPASGTRKVPASDQIYARERDASGPLGAAYGDAPLTEPRRTDEVTTGRASAAGPGERSALSVRFKNFA